MSRYWSGRVGRCSSPLAAGHLVRGAVARCSRDRRVMAAGHDGFEQLAGPVGRLADALVGVGGLFIGSGTIPRLANLRGASSEFSCRRVTAAALPASSRLSDEGHEEPTLDGAGPEDGFSATFDSYAPAVLRFARRRPESDQLLPWLYA